jgi:SAM-dependent methyltransferase
MAASSEVASLTAGSRVQAHFEDNVGLYVDKSLACYRSASMGRLSTLATVTGFHAFSKFRLLDVGCGGGFFLDLFLQAFPGASACGVDFCPAMLEVNAPCSRKELHQGDALHLPEEIGDFEVINIDTVLHHLIDGMSYRRTVARIAQCLKHLQSRLTPGGVICVREIYHEYLVSETFGSRFLFFVSTLSLPKWMENILKSMGIQTANAGVCFLTRDQWFQLFQENGLSVLSIRNEPWSTQPYRRYGFKASGDIYYVLAPSRPYV